MGGVLSPALLDTGHLETAHSSHPSHPSQQLEQTDTDKPDELELMYDPQLNCFYDPVTYKYYELI